MTDRKAALDAAMKTLEKNFGAGAAMRMDDAPTQKVDVISTGSLKIDHILGCGGIPRGRASEISGVPSSGKTTVCLACTARSQAAGGVVAYIDAEHALDMDYASSLGVQPEQMIVAQPDTGEQGLEIAQTFIKSGAVDLVVIDSVAAMVPRAEIDGEFGDSHVGLHARLWSQAMRKMVGPLHQTNTALILVNQIREKIGVTWGSPEVTTGGRAIPFYSSVRLDMRRTSTLKEGDEAVANRVKVKVTKNKLAPPFRACEVDITFGEGINRYGELVDLGVEYGVIDKSGSWFRYAGEQLGQGRPKVMAVLREDLALAGEIEAKVKAQMWAR